MSEAPISSDTEDYADGPSDRFERLRDAAIQAEYETGVREENVEEARASLVKRAARITLGIVVTIAGIIALPLPGPGWLIIIGGLTILSKDFPFIARWIAVIRSRVPGIPEDGEIPRRTKIIIGTVVIASLAGSIWFSAFGGREVLTDLWNDTFA